LKHAPEDRTETSGGRREEDCPGAHPKNADWVVGATVRFRSADGRVLTGEIRSVEHHVLGKRLRVLSGSVVMIVNVDQLV
jgi:hypothetical protein